MNEFDRDADLPSNLLLIVAGIRFHALRITLNLMLHKKRLDWSAWTVEICDASGRHVVSRPFADALTIRQARQG